MEKIYALLGDSDPRKQIDGVEYMCIFIQRLDIPNSDEWNFILDIQNKWTPDKGFYTNMFHENGNNNYYNTSMKQEMYYPEIFKIWRELSKFMNGTYFKGWNGSKAQENRPSRPL